MTKTKWPKNKAHKQITMAASPGAGIEAMWSYCTKKEERVNGEVREVVRCLFCDDKLSNTATRIEEHLTGLRLRGGVLEEIKRPCTSIATDLKEAMVTRKKRLYNKRVEKKRAHNNFLQRSSSLNYQKSEAMPQQKLPAMMNNTRAAKEVVDSALCEMIYDNNLPARLVESVTFRKFCHVLKTRGPEAYTPVARHQIMEVRLDERVATARAKRQQLYSSFGANGFSCGSDGARINKHALVNFVMFSVAIGTISWTTKDASEHMEAGGVKDAEFIATIMLDQAEAELSEKQLESWVLLILDGASNNISAMPKMKGKSFFPFACLGC